MKQIAVGIPVYNGEAFLKEAIESVLNQSFPDFDLVISDNASTDATEEISRHYARLDSRVRYVRQPVNVGAAQNHNLLVALTESKYFKWAAHDDVLAPSFLEQCLQVLEADPGMVLASPATTLIDTRGMPLPYSAERGGLIDEAGICWPVMPEENPMLTSHDPAARFEAVMAHTVMCVEIFGLMRRTALARTGLQGRYSGADKVLLAEMALLGRYWLGRDRLFFRRCHARQYSSAKSGAYRAAWFAGQPASMFGHQLELLRAYCRLAWNAEGLTAGQRLRCFRAIYRRGVTRGNTWQRLTGAVVHTA